MVYIYTSYSVTRSFFTYFASEGARRGLSICSRRGYLPASLYIASSCRQWGPSSLLDIRQQKESTEPFTPQAWQTVLVQVGKTVQKGLGRDLLPRMATAFSDIIGILILSRTDRAKGWKGEKERRKNKAKEEGGRRRRGKYLINLLVCSLAPWFFVFTLSPI